MEVGQIIQPGQGLFTLIPLNDVWVTADFKETQLAKVRPSQKAASSRKVRQDGHRIRGFHRRRYRLTLEPASARNTVR